MQLNARWKLKRDAHCWHLIQISKGVATTGPRQGEEIEKYDTTYHGDLRQALRKCADVEAGQCETLTEALDRIERIYAGPCHLQNWGVQNLEVGSEVELRVEA